MGLTALRLPRPKDGFRALRTLKVANNEAMQKAEGVRFWGLGYLAGVFSKPSLQALHLQNATSWCHQDLDDLDRPVTLRLEPGSLGLTKLEMDNCSLRKQDMQVLLSMSIEIILKGWRQSDWKI